MKETMVTTALSLPGYEVVRSLGELDETYPTVSSDGRWTECVL